MADPAVVAESKELAEPVEETEEILKSELDTLRTQAGKVGGLETSETNRKGYTGRRVQDATKPLEDRIRELEDEKSTWKTGDPDVDDLRTKAGRDHIQNTQAAKDLKEERKLFDEERLQNLAERLAVKYDMDASLLAEAKSELEMENIALRTDREKAKAERRTVTGIDLGQHGASAVGSFRQVEEQYIKGLIDAEKYGIEARKAGKL